jgi:hypothetical protein
MVPPEPLTFVPDCSLSRRSAPPGVRQALRQRGGSMLSARVQRGAASVAPCTLLFLAGVYLCDVCSCRNIEGATDAGRGRRAPLQAERARAGDTRAGTAAADGRQHTQSFRSVAALTCCAGETEHPDRPQGGRGAHWGAAGAHQHRRAAGRRRLVSTGCDRSASADAAAGQRRRRRRRRRRRHWHAHGRPQLIGASSSCAGAGAAWGSASRGAGRLAAAARLR